MRYAISYEITGHGVLFITANNDDETYEKASELLDDEDTIIKNMRMINADGFDIDVEEEE